MDGKSPSLVKAAVLLMTMAEQPTPASKQGLRGSVTTRRQPGGNQTLLVPEASEASGPACRGRSRTLEGEESLLIARDQEGLKEKKCHQLKTHCVLL